MRKTLTSRFTNTLLIIVAILAALAVVSAGAFTAGAQAQPTSTAQPDMMQPDGALSPESSPEAILAMAAIASDEIDSGSGDFVISVTIDSDETAASGGMQVFLDQPITLSGTYLFNGDPVAFESMMDLSIAGQNIPLGLKATGGQTWLQFLGRWYDVPMDAAGDTSGEQSDQAGIDTFAQALTEPEVDPSTWLRDLMLVGEEDIEGTNAYHLTATLNTEEMLGDILMLLQDPFIMQLIGGLDVTNEDIVDAQEAVVSWGSDVSLDMWVATDTYEFMQFQINAALAPPAGEGDGVDGLTAEATVTLEASGAPVTVEPPTDSRPFSELEQMLDALTGMFGGGMIEPGMSPRSTGTTMPVD